MSEADEVDPEEILDPSNDLLIGNNIIYIPYLTGPSVRETVPPWGNITAPTNNSVVFGLVKVNFTGGDNVCVALTIIMVDGKVEGVVFGTNGTYAWNTMTVDDGFHEIKLLTIDCAGNVNETRYVYKVSNVHPYVSIVSPSNYTWVSGAAYPITIYSSDNNPDNLKIYVNGVLKQTLFDDAAIGYITYRLDTREYANGSTVEVKAVLTDLDGFSDYDLVYVKIDNEPPYAEITYPANNSIIGASTNVTIDVGDALAFSHAEVYLNSTLVKNTTVSGIQNVTLDLSTYPYNSTVEVELIAYDEAGNTNSTVMYYTVDNLGPSINITSPTTTVVKDTVWINATANDTNYVTKIEIYINNTLIYYEEYNSLEANISYLWDTTQYDDGKYNVTVVAYDSLGNVGSETKFYYIDNLPPPIPEHYITALLALITASIITCILLRKKH
ncbi:MAG TPA: hypothetical protein ENF75_04790 [Acidilobales archaeon]|nr:hypothetical protein [Acidilobales archaeon]